MSPVRARYTYVYVLRSVTSGRMYTGCTSGLRKRLLEHAGGARAKVDYELIYFEGCKNILDAYAREKYLKTGMGKRYLKNRNKRFLALTG